MKRRSDTGLKWWCVAMFMACAGFLSGCDEGQDQGALEMIWHPVYNEPPIARFEVVGESYANGDTFFHNLSSDPNLDDLLEFKWYFSDGAISRDRNAKHRFVEPGRHLVTLSAMDDHSDWATYSTDVMVLPTPIADLILYEVCIRESGDGSGRGELYLKIIAFNGVDTSNVSSNTLTYSVPPGGCIPFGNRIVAYSGIPQDYIAFIIIAMDHDDVGFWLKLVDFAKSTFGILITAAGAPPEVGTVVGGLFEIADYAIRKAGEDDVVFIFNDVLLPSENWMMNRTINVVETDHPYSPAAYTITYGVMPH